ncbi:MAG: ribosome maturation factor RimM [Bacteroidales bacterium]|jgi:16S rRNA processing protein RimM|nr:ribosome maturation factor RimM [Bacteroidales bacterium]
MKDFFYLGVITKPFGYKGQAFIYLDTDQPEKYSDLESVFLHVDDEMVPYMIEEIQLRGSNQAVVKFADIDGDEIKSFMKTELYLPITALPPLTGNKFYFHEVIGFHVIDSVKGDIGTIVDFIDVIQQPIMQIDFNGKEILIPAVDHFFESIDRAKKEIYIKAPDGLIDVYIDE